MDNAAYHTVYKTIRNEMATKGDRPSASEDPLKNTAGEVMTSKEILRVCRYLMDANDTAGDRNLSLNNWLLSVCGRSDDGRLVYQADFCPPRLIHSIGMYASNFLACMCGAAWLIPDAYSSSKSSYYRPKCFGPKISLGCHGSLPYSS